MARLTALFVAFSAVALHVNGLPLTKRVAQVISDSTTKWEAACDTAGGGSQCNVIAVNSFSTLLAAPGPCAQQNAADTMVSLAKQLNSNEMITLAQVFAQQPRNSPSSQAVPYCQQAPNNTELNGLYQCQFQSVNEQTFVGGLAVGSAGTIPFGLSAPVSPAGSCPANPSGTIPDGQQLVDITQNPGVGSSGSGSSNATANASAAASSAASASATVAAVSSSAPVSASAPASATAGSGSCVAPSVASSVVTPVASSSAAGMMASASATASASSGNSSSSSFQQANGQAAQALNAQFASLTANSTCNAGDNACISSGFAQCVNGQYVNLGCASGLQCFALPLVNKQGTSIACTTQADALARIQATGAQGGVTGN
ncbi:hypothetical protein BKA93DRAFT_748474 [Sparassis latifolia]|uniref:Carbohydrate-binding module family 19 domain-containing protein n=1 Tax=Sparassis crispa TaxID=139825 RepID=A0A401GVF6_9APHY|nr:hypothetical protein SCP_0900870 [Sparassis crispa]GBE86208.1 hypothetical protein SCP_0900870 [Sparassis crispa]